MKRYGLMMLGLIIFIGRHKIRKLLNASIFLIKDIERNGVLSGIGEPEALKGNLHGEYSRRINEKDRLVYHMEDDRLYIASCRGHYDDN